MTQGNEQPLPIQSAQQPRHYRGGLSSSICGLFSDPYARHDCCAFVCCGWFLHNRNRYALTGSRPPSRWGLVLLIFLAVAVSAFLFPLNFVILGVEIGLLVALIAQTIQRARFRNLVIARMNDEDGEEQYDSSFCSEPRNAHRCFAFIPVDELHHDLMENQNRNKDFCFHVWRMLAMLCCGCCGCWCNWCGMCAIGQEHRELRRVLPRDRFWFDYVTFQPYKEYASRIELIRRSQTASFWDHLSSLSSLSSKLLKFLIVSIFLLIIAAAFLKNFSLANVAVIIFTLFQAFGVVYIVHWRNHRFDLSIDAVIKLFASGFFLAVSIAMVAEVIINQIGNLFFIVVITKDYIEDNPDADFDNPENAPSTGDILKDLYEHHVMVLVAIVFFQSFIVAAFTEELSKYFGFWMVEHTDYMPEETVKDIIRSEDSDTTEDSAIGIDQINQPVHDRGIHSRAAAIRVGLISTAAGFACSENLMYTLGVGMSAKQGKNLQPSRKDTCIMIFSPVFRAGSTSP